MNSHSWLAARVSLIIGCSLLISCSVKRQNSVKKEVNITYAKQIHPIISQHCTSCHQPGQAAPFSLFGYKDVKLRSDLILYVVENKIMPPWPADPSYRSFMNENILTEEEISLLK